VINLLKKLAFWWWNIEDDKSPKGRRKFWSLLLGGMASIIILFWILIPGLMFLSGCDPVVPFNDDPDKILRRS